MSLRDPEQLQADIGRWAREIRHWRAQGLTDEHPNIKRRLNRIALAQHFLRLADPSLCETCGGECRDEGGPTVTDWQEAEA